MRLAISARLSSPCRPHVALQVSRVDMTNTLAIARSPAHILRRATGPRRAAGARHVFLRPRRAAGMAKGAASLRGIPLADRRQVRHGAGGGGSLAAPVPRGSGHGPPPPRVKRCHCALYDLAASAELTEAVEPIVPRSRAAGKTRFRVPRPASSALCGTTGTGKTLTAQAAASAPGSPSAHVAPRLGEAMSNVGRPLGCIGGRGLVALLGESGRTGRKRGGPHGHGEPERAAGSLARLPDGREGGALAVAAAGRRRAPDVAARCGFRAILRLVLSYHASRMALPEKHLGGIGQDGDVGAETLARMAEGRPAADMAHTRIGALCKGVAGDGDAVGSSDAMWPPADGGAAS